MCRKLDILRRIPASVLDLPSGRYDFEENVSWKVVVERASEIGRLSELRMGLLSRMVVVDLNDRNGGIAVVRCPTHKRASASTAANNAWASPTSGNSGVGENPSSAGLSAARASASR